MSLTLYTNPMSRGFIAEWMLEEVQQPYEKIILEYGEAMKASKYLAINPMGKVPALTHNDSVITEAAAICAYLAETFPETQLAPKNQKERAAYYRWLFFTAGPVEQAIFDHHMELDIPPQKQPMAGYGTYEQTVKVLEQAISQSPYITGDRFTAADVYVGSHILWGMQFGTLPSKATFEEYTQRLTQRPAYKKVNANSSQE